jgi:hypothetical protein
MCGFKPRDLKLAYQRTVEALSAIKVQVSYDRQSGVEVSRVEHVDHMTRVIAAKQLMSMIPDMFPQAHGGAIQTGQGVIVEVVLCSPDGTRTAIRVDTQAIQSPPPDDSNEQAIESCLP